MMQKTLFKISKMDCPSEENLIRMKLDDIKGIKKLDFNIEQRKLSIYHEGDIEEIKSSIHDLNLDEEILWSKNVQNIVIDESENQRKLLWAVLIINFGFFLIEMFTGILSKSMGLVADSLDMLADSFVYGISLFAVGGTIARKKKIATLSGYFQITLAVIGFIEVIRRFLGFENLPDFSTMIIV